jgi:hypothetical protein
VVEVQSNLVAVLTYLLCIQGVGVPNTRSRFRAIDSTGPQPPFDLVSKGEFASKNPLTYLNLQDLLFFKTSSRLTRRSC